MKRILALLSLLSIHALAEDSRPLSGTPDTLGKPAYNAEKDQACDQLASDLYKRDSVSQATIGHWRLQAETLEAKDANWQQAWNTLLSEHKTCTQALRTTLEAATSTPPPSPMRPKIQAAAGGLLAGLALGWLLFGL